MPYYLVHAHALRKSVEAWEADGERAVSMLNDATDPTLVHVLTVQERPAAVQHERSV